MPNVNSKGPWTHRWLVWLFTAIFGLLVYWLLGFVVGDIGSLPAPDYGAIEAQMLEPALVRRSEELADETAQTRRRIDDEEKRQTIVRDSTANSQTTMNQLVELQRLALQRNVTPTDEERQALAESEQLFLENQRQYQRLNEQIAQLSEQLRDLEEQQLANQKLIEAERRPVEEEYQQLHEKHSLKIAALKLAFLTPLLIAGVALYMKYRSGTYAALVYAFGVAVLVKVGFVMHEYFPARYFKYVLILVTLAVALRVLVYLLRMVAFPKQDWLVRQYGEAYEAFLCPICGHPIRRGPLKYMAWTRRSIKRLVAPTSPANISDQPYTCPACSTQLYEACPSCGTIRHSLLPACEQCGNIKILSPPTRRSPA